MTVEERIKQQRDQKLIDLGYFIREYEPQEQEQTEGVTPRSRVEISKEYPEYDISKNLYYRIVPMEVTDEQFKRIIEIGGEPKHRKKGILVTVLTIIGWLFLAAALFYAIEDGPRDDRILFYSLFAYGFVGLWAAEVLKLLHRINRKL